MSEGIMKCELCRANVISMGKTTHYYKNLDHEQIKKLEAENAEKHKQIHQERERALKIIEENSNLNRDYEYLQYLYWEMFKIHEENESDLKNLLKKMQEALEKIAGMERLTFAECSDAEFIVGTAKQALEESRRVMNGTN